MPAAKPSVFVLGPSLDNVIEPVPATTTPDATTPGKRQIAFHPTTPTTPGGNVHLVLQPPLNPGDVLPINVYAFFHQPVEEVPAVADRTPDWFFKSGAKSGSVHISTADPTTGDFTVPVSGVQPSLKPYFVQTVLEFQGS